MLRKYFFASVLVVCAAPLVAQTAPPANSPSPARPARRGNFPSCWQRAGIDRSVMEQLWSIQRDMRTRVEDVCSNTSLTPEQKHQQTHEIREQAHQKIAGLITPDQQKSLMACRDERMGGHAGAGGFGGPRGGCGEPQNNGTRPPSETPDANGNNPPPAN
ncbi:MAG TPA: hypothetical protein VE377_18795 [Candidatus Dormibacteraeota bacterium]|nr:hypothetical protein [Candidatus Dormibacteraeota bacterium]